MTIHLKEFSSEELKEELDCRDRLQQISPVASLPSTEKLVEFVNYLENWKDAVATGQADDDDTFYIFEAAVNLIFGDDFFEWYNSVKDRK